MAEHFVIDSKPPDWDEVSRFVFRRSSFESIRITEDCKSGVLASHRTFLGVLESGTPIYGVTTGFGDSCNRRIGVTQSEELQRNLISYLLCGAGKMISREATRAICLFRLLSLTRGYSGVSWELIERLKLYLEKDWLPRIPAQGSLGASGDLIPLAYLAQILQGEGEVETPGGERSARELLEGEGLLPYRLKSKEGLALVNGTSAMNGIGFTCVEEARFLVELSTLTTGWLVLALRGRPEAFSPLVNERAKKFVGQAQIAKWVRAVLTEESYEPPSLSGAREPRESGPGAFPLQDRYSLRCAPQILGPVLDTVTLVESWVQIEYGAASDNPLVAGDGNWSMGGNFYGGYLSHGMDYLKVSLGHVADLIDRQLTLLIDEKSNRGLPPNLANWPEIEEGERFLHHGLKGLHQAVNAITSEILAACTPNGIFSRSSESHNQDKVSLGTSAATRCQEILDSLFTVQAFFLTCLAQALDLRKVSLRGDTSRYLYDVVRSHIEFVRRDVSLGLPLERLAQALRALCHRGKRPFTEGV